MNYARWFQKLSRCISNNDLRKVPQRNITTFFSWITTDSIEIFSITFCTLVTNYCNCRIAKDAFRIVVYVTGLLHAALRCNSFRFKTVICLRFWARRTCARSLIFFTASHFYLALVAPTKFSCLFSNKKKSPWYFLSVALDLCRHFSGWASLACRLFFSVFLLLYIPNLWTSQLI